MAGTPRFKVYRNGEYVAAAKYLEDAAAIVALSGGEIRCGHAKKYTLWREGEESQSAGDSLDHVAEVCAARMEEGRERNWK